MDDKMTLKDWFNLAKDITLDARSTKITAAAAVLAGVGAVAAGVDPTIGKCVWGAAGLGAIKLTTGYVSVGWEALKKLNIPS